MLLNTSQTNALCLSLFRIVGAMRVRFHGFIHLERVYLNNQHEVMAHQYHK